jgi:hypothetical protein
MTVITNRRTVGGRHALSKGTIVLTAIIGFLLTVNSTNAHCYSIWRYHIAQRCGVVATHVVHRPPAEPKDWYVEIVLTPQVMDEISHGVGIDKIKQLNHEEKP